MSELPGQLRASLENNFPPKKKKRKENNFQDPGACYPSLEERVVRGDLQAGPPTTMIQTFCEAQPTSPLPFLLYPCGRNG